MRLITVRLARSLQPGFNEVDQPPRPIALPVPVRASNNKGGGGGDSSSAVVLRQVVVGSSSVGKTAFMRRLTENSFVKSGYVATTCTDMRTRVQVGSDAQGVEHKITHKLIDTPGQERLQSLTRLTYCGANCVYIMYDLTNRQSFLDVPTWKNQAMRHASPHTVFVLVGNKSDLDKHGLRQVHHLDAAQMATVSVFLLLHFLVFFF